MFLTASDIAWMQSHICRGLICLLEPEKAISSRGRPLPRFGVYAGSRRRLQGRLNLRWLPVLFLVERPVVAEKLGRKTPIALSMVGSGTGVGLENEWCVFEVPSSLCSLLSVKEYPGALYLLNELNGQASFRHRRSHPRSGLAKPCGAHVTFNIATC